MDKKLTNITCSFDGGKSTFYTNVQDALEARSRLNVSLLEYILREYITAFIVILLVSIIFGVQIEISAESLTKLVFMGELIKGFNGLVYRSVL